MVIIKQVILIMAQNKQWLDQDKVLKSNTLVILYGLQSLQTPWLSPLLLPLLHFHLLRNYLQLSYLLRHYLLTLRQAALLPPALLSVKYHRPQLLSLPLHRARPLLVLLHNLRYIGDIVYFFRVGGLRPFAFSASRLLNPGQQFLYLLRSDQFAFQQFFLEELYEFLVSEVLLEAASGQKLALFGSISESADALLVGVHEGDHGGEDGANVPAGTPGFLVIVGESGADGLADLEAAVVGEEADLRGREGVVFGQVEDAMVEALPVFFFQSVEAEVEGEVVFSVDEDGRDGFLVDALHFLVDAHIGDLLAHLSYISILCQTINIYLSIQVEDFTIPFVPF